MKALFCLCLISLTVHGQDYPRFNPLVNIYTNEYVNSAFETLQKSGVFQGKITSNYAVSGQYQGQKLELMVFNGSSFYLKLSFNKAADYLKFITAARDFFVQDEPARDTKSADVSCKAENFRKPDFKAANLIIEFSDCLKDDSKKHEYTMSIKRAPGLCGNRF